MNDLKNRLRGVDATHRTRMIAYDVGLAEQSQGFREKVVEVRRNDDVRNCVLEK